MHNPPLVAVVILNYNGRHYLQQFLPSVLASSYPRLQVIVGDNASTDDSVHFLQTSYPQLRIIHNQINHGFAKGYNEVLKQVNADYYVLLNSDVEVTPGWIEPIIELMESNVSIGACQPKMLDFKQRDHFEYAGAAGGWLDVLGYPFSRGRLFDHCETDRGQYDNTTAVFWASGAAFFVRAALFAEMHGFDEMFFAHQEEIDLCWRLQLAGYTIMACPTSVVYHVGGGTLPKGGRKVYLNFRNNLVMLAKNLPIGQMVWKLPVRIGLDAISAWKGLLTGDPAFFTAVFKAHFFFLKWLVGSRRNNLFPRVKTGKCNGYYKGSVVWQYFARHKKTFDEIVNESQR